jgi:hypothetical protein
MTRKSTLVTALTVSAILGTFGCGPTSIGGTGGTGGVGGAGGTGGGTGGSDAGPTQCTDVPPGMLCIDGTPTTGPNNEAQMVLNVGDPLRIVVRPSGCWSSSCTDSQIASCSVSGNQPFVAQARFCLAQLSRPACTDDCSGGGFARCESEATLTAGQHTVKIGNLSLDFTVPSTISGLLGLCMGRPY